MRVFSFEDVDAAFERQAAGKVSTDHAELREGQFCTFDEFEKYMHERRGPIWIESLVVLSRCKMSVNLWQQWRAGVAIFRKFHVDHMEWLVNPSLCPTEVEALREAELEQLIALFANGLKCHWKRNHEFVCFCDIN